ncbi:3-deoxy-manno-octulosonate cytidylyltransferase [Kangiella sediminilitoris]|uniref:3-deoxy-manno-octulosonate cytidylyltransferase n=1 Tax=Kangiella sediminilitoris TaxID=1144748 RepID=A0A1B3BAP5_9GAMM|nr:3-deoxy-manno-octulosonate cytidylyltransferase [Kangiella sediminilitoris]AOE49872.1 3-deoxy-manno-octulosonate cytidylyltransferase [Kangiella sediminilitoris]
MPKTGFIVVIPARYASTRLPGKPLSIIGDKPMVQHVYERALLSGADKVIVATDDKRIEDAVISFGGYVCMTRDDHLSGSDRLAEVCKIEGLGDDEIVVNVQGDEPFISPENISQVAENLSHHTDCVMSTLSTPVTDEGDIFNSNIVKVVAANSGKALYFSRAAIPWQRGSFENHKVASLQSCERHIGIYAYRAGFLKQYVEMQPADIERLESLEQLRVLANGYHIHVETAQEVPGLGVDTEEDLSAANSYYRKHQL